VVAADACRSDGVPSLLGSPLLRKRELHLRPDCSNEGIQRPSILVVIDIAVSNCLPHVPHLEPYPHHRGPLDIVGLGEGRPPAAETDIPDNALDSMVPIWGGRAAPPVKAVISVNPAAGASAPVWAAVAVEDTAAARAPTRSVWGCATAHYAACSRAGSLASLSSLSLSSSVETELPVLLARRASSSSAATTSASCRCYTLKALSVETVLRTWCASGGLLRGGRGCLRRAAARLCRRGGMSRDSWCSCCRLRTEGGVGRG
jgi:hypothetical protein